MPGPVDTVRTRSAVNASLESADLTARLVAAVRMAAEAVRAVTPAPEPPPGPEPTSARPLLRPKVLAESAMLLRSAAALAGGSESLRSAVRQLEDLLRAATDRDSLLAALCLEPGAALDHATAYLHLRVLGHPDAGVDRLLAACLAGSVRGPERLPHRRIEQDWLRGLWDPDSAGPPFSLAGTSRAGTTLAGTCLADPLDALASATEDLYAFTHAVLYATDHGRRPVRLPRPIEAILADAEAGLAASLDADNHDLTVELLWTWPMLHRAFSPAARFAWSVVTAVQDRHGFLPGPDYLAGEHERLAAAAGRAYVIKTAYHTTIAMGLLCAAVLGRHPSVRESGPPPATGAGDAVRSALPPGRLPRVWESAYQARPADERDAVAGLLLGIALRRARTGYDLAALRRALGLASELGLTEGPAVRQATELLQRATLLARLTG